MLALLLPPPAAAQQGRVAAARPAPCQTPAAVVASQTTLCQGGSAVLTLTEGCGPAVAYPNTWTPNQDLSSPTGGQVVVNPLVTTTYTVTSTAAGLAPRVLSVTIAVQANCCQRSYGQNIVELTSSYYGYNPAVPNTGDPFRNYPPGTYFHLAAGTVTLDNNQFQPPTGSVLLLDAGADLILTDARLILNGVTITAACDEMWGRVHELSNGHGIVAGPVQTLRPRLMHSLGGLVQEDKLLNSSRLQLSQMDFLQNYQSLAMNFVTVPAHSTDFVQDCRFDSDPALLKSPYKGTAQDYWYSQQHVSLRGDAGLMPFARNSFRHAMEGIVLLDKSLPVLTVDNCHFEELYLAGIVFNDDYHPGTGALLTVQNSRFTFPAGTDLPPTSQVALSVGNSYALTANETVGVAPLFVPTVVTNTVFEQPSTALYTTFQYGNYRTRQVGLASHKLNQAFDNTFQGLHVGIAHFLRDGDTNTEVRGNFFTECEKGYDAMPIALASPTASTGTAYVSCNSFVRGVNAATRTGVSYGLYNERTSYVTLANPNTQGDPLLKNLFDDAGTGVAGFYALYNANSSMRLSYNTFDSYRISTVASLVDAAQVDLSTHSPTIDYSNTNTDCHLISPNAGLQRAANASPTTGASNSKPSLEQNVPNPARGTTSIVYHVPNGTQNATLLIRRAVDGESVAALLLNVAATRCEVSVTHYPAGIYFYTLVADGLPSLTRRLVVQ